MPPAKREHYGLLKDRVIARRPAADVAIRSPKPSPERRRWLEEPDEVAVKFLGSSVPRMSLRTSPQTGVAIRFPNGKNIEKKPA